MEIENEPIRMLKKYEHINLKVSKSRVINANINFLVLSNATNIVGRLLLSSRAADCIVENQTKSPQY